MRYLKRHIVVTFALISIATTGWYIKEDIEATFGQTEIPGFSIESQREAQSIVTEAFSTRALEDTQINRRLAATRFHLIQKTVSHEQ